METTSYSETIQTTLLNKGDPAEKRAEIRKYFLQTHALYESLFDLLKSDESFYIKADPLRHPLIFYYCHTAVFYINKLITMKLIDKRINPLFESLFAVGLDEMSWDDYNDAHYDWPTVDTARNYREQVKNVVLSVIDNLPLSIPITWGSSMWIILMGIEHERIHLETSSVLIRQLPLEHVNSNKNWPAWLKDNSPPKNHLIAVKGGTMKLGKTHDDATIYGWDNEYGKAEFSVPAFAASEFLVSNQEFFEFIEAGGYSQEKFWQTEGWQWRTDLKIEMPRFWKKQGNNYFLRLLTEEISMPWSWPVEINFHEAKAFCNYLSEKKQCTIRLPTEAEWYYLYQQSIDQHYPNWKNVNANIDLAFCASSMPVNAFKHGQFYDIIGNVWQWTETPFKPFLGFQHHPAYDDFSLPTFEGLHNVIKGGSWISTGNLAVCDSRYAFRRHFYQHAGFRYIKGEPLMNNNNSHIYYETDKLLSEYLEFHFGETYFNCENYLKSLVYECLKVLPENQRHRALDLGCAVGRASFECANYFSEVCGIDFSARFVTAAVQLQEKGAVSYAICEEGELLETRHCDLAKLDIDLNKANRIQFLQGDACNLKTHIGQFDLVIASNLIDRLYDPLAFLKQIAKFITPNGILAIASPYTWLADHTPKESWLGGIRRDGESIKTFAALQHHLQNNFELVQEPKNIEFVIRETKRKYQHSIAELSLWRRK